MKGKEEREKGGGVGCIDHTLRTEEIHQQLRTRLPVQEHWHVQA